MRWYVLRTVSGQEEKNLLLLRCLFKELEFIFPKRRLSWRKKGQVFEVIKPLFGGYLFVEATAKQIKELDLSIRANRLDVWFVKIAKEIFPITSGEASLMKELMCYGDIIERSDIVRIGEKVSIVGGPLVGLEGIVERYSKKHHRVTVRVTVGGEEKRIDLEGRWLDID